MGSENVRRRRGTARTIAALWLGGVAALGGCGPKGEEAAAPPVEVVESLNLAVGRLRPYREVNQVVNERLFGAGAEPLRLSDYIEDPPEMKDTYEISDILAMLAPRLVELLGGYNGDGLRNDLQNATPNSVNLLLWYLALDGLVNELGQVCAPDAAIVKFSLAAVRPDVVDLLRRFCAQTETQEFDEATLAGLWERVMRADATVTEWEAWRSFVTNGALAGQSGPAAVHTALMAMLYNPHFLLQK